MGLGSKNFTIKNVSNSGCSNVSFFFHLLNEAAAKKFYRTGISRKQITKLHPKKRNDNYGSLATIKFPFPSAGNIHLHFQSYLWGGL